MGNPGWQGLIIRETQQPSKTGVCQAIDHLESFRTSQLTAGKSFSSSFRAVLGTTEKGAARLAGKPDSRVWDRQYAMMHAVQGWHQEFRSVRHTGWKNWQDLEMENMWVGRDSCCQCRCPHARCMKQMHFMLRDFRILEVEQILAMWLHAGCWLPGECTEVTDKRMPRKMKILLSHCLFF